MKILKALTLFLSLGISIVYGQQSSIKPLKVGDNIPDLTLENVINVKYKHAKLSDYKDKVIILYFWGLGCAPCIRALPKYNELQKKYSDRLQFIPVTYEKQDKIKALLEKRWPAESKLILPFVVSDTILHKYFPYYSQPHPVWINSQGKVLAIGDPLFLTEDNIKKAIQGTKFEAQLLEKRPSLDLNIFKDQSIHLDSSSVFRSYLAKGRRDLESGTNGSGFELNDPQKFYIKAYGYSLVQLYRQALDVSMLPKNQIIYKGIKNMMPYLVYPKFDDPQKSFDWMKNNLYIYHLEFDIGMPVITQAERNKKADSLKAVARRFMKQELDRYFGFLYGLSVTKERRTMKCMVITRSSKDDSRYQSRSTVRDFGYEGDYEVFTFVSMTGFAEALTAKSDIPIVNETDYKEPVDLRIPTAALKDMNLLRKSLQSYGLNLQEAEREMEVLVFKEDHSKPQQTTK